VTWDPSADAWLAGFADGEGYFQLRRTRQCGWRIEPRFRIHLRADDIQILERLAETFGGHVRRGKNGVWSPQAHWLVSSKADLLPLVGYFDRFPLRAKKAGDYAIWREAVLIFCENSGVHPELFRLHDALVACRAYPVAA
jgi:hypothetical protein